MNKKEYKIKVEVDLVLDTLDCPICICRLEEATITKCGHTFCLKCLQEVYNQKHQCPLCNKPIQSIEQDCIRNYQIENVIKLLTDQKEIETKHYYDQLTSKAIKAEQISLQKQDSDQISENQMSSNVIENIFTLNLRESLLSFQSYQQGIINEKERETDKIKRHFSQKIIEAQNNQEVVGKLQIEMKEQIQKMKMNYERAQQILMEQYDQHMKQILPKPSLMPIRIDLKIQIIQNDGKIVSSIDLNNIFQVKPYETIDYLFDQIKKFYEPKDPIIDFQIQKVIFKGPLYIENDEQEIMQSSQVGSSNKVEVSNFLLSFNELGLSMQSTGVTIVGDIKFKSNQPLECLTLTYKKDDPLNTTYNYYSCKNCNLNWICEWCRDGCHSDHQVLPHILDHRPTWACCNCVKKGVCKIKNIKNKDKK